MAGLFDSSDAAPATSQRGYPLIHETLYNFFIITIKKEMGATGLEPVTFAV